MFLYTLKWPSWKLFETNLIELPQILSKIFEFSLNQVQNGEWKYFNVHQNYWNSKPSLKLINQQPFFFL